MCTRHPMLWIQAHEFHLKALLSNRFEIFLLILWCNKMQTYSVYIYLATMHTSWIVNKQVHTLIIMRAGFFLSEHDVSAPLLLKCHFTSFSSLILSVNTSSFLPAASCVSLSRAANDRMHMPLFLSRSRPYWLSDVELIKDNVKGVSVPVRGIKSRWRSNGPLIIILLLVRMGEIITLQAQSAGTRSVYFSLYPCPQSPIFISSNSALSFPLSISLSLYNHAALLSYSTGH